MNARPAFSIDTFPKGVAVKTKLILILAMLCSTPALAGGLFDGFIKTLQFSPGVTAARVSIRVGPHASGCPNGFGADWFAFENADSGLGKIWTAALLTAYTSGRAVAIGGNDICDPFGIEGVSYIEVKP